jgi:hypothetical protein
VTFSDAILSCFGANELFINLETGERFQAITETDLAYRLREKGWKLPATGFFLHQVEQAGFTVKQIYAFKGGKVARSYSTLSDKHGRIAGHSDRGRCLSQYNTLITL